MPFTEHRLKSSDGLSLYYRSYGNADRCVLCLHGLTRNSKDFHRLAVRLSADFRVLVPDMRGRGQSQRDPNFRNYRPGTYVGDSWRILQEESIDSFSLVGTSMGGIMGMIMADQQPGRISRMILNDVGPELPPEAISRLLQYVGKTPACANHAELIQQLQSNYGLAFPGEDATFWKTLANDAYTQDQHGHWVPDADPAIGTALRRSVGAVKWLQRLRKLGLVKRVQGVPINLWDAFDQLGMPLLLIRGELSDVLPPALLQRMLDSQPDMQVVNLPNRGHAPTLDEPQAVEAIADFLKTAMI